MATANLIVLDRRQRLPDRSEQGAQPVTESLVDLVDDSGKALAQRSRQDRHRSLDDRVKHGAQVEFYGPVVVDAPASHIDPAATISSIKADLRVGFALNAKSIIAARLIVVA